MNRYAFPCARLATRIQHKHVRARQKSIHRSITTAARLRLALRYAQSTPVTFTGEQSAYTSSSSPAANVFFMRTIPTYRTLPSSTILDVDVDVDLDVGVGVDVDVGVEKAGDDG